MYYLLHSLPETHSRPKGITLISVFCETHQKNALLPLSAIEAIGPMGTNGRAVRFQCHCGHRGTHSLSRASR